MEGASVSWAKAGQVKPGNDRLEGLLRSFLSCWAGILRGNTRSKDGWILTACLGFMENILHFMGLPLFSPYPWVEEASSAGLWLCGTCVLSCQLPNGSFSWQRCSMRLPLCEVMGL